MFRIRRLGHAAVTIVLSATIIGAGPSQAWEISHSASNPLPSIAAAAEPAQVVLPTEIAPAAPSGDGTVVADTVAPPPIVTDTASTIPPIVFAPVPLSAPASAPAVPALVPTVRASLAQLVASHRSSAIPDRERECLAGAIYFESKGEPLSGQVAVGQVIANRAKSGRFPSSYCGVVFQRSQFSFVRGRALPPIPRASAHWKTAVAVAHIVANGLTQAVAPKSLFFHARYVSPNWKRMSRVATVGNHVFDR